jgi:hypothetical protein
MIRIIFLSMKWPVLLSLVTAAWFGYLQTPYVDIIVLAVWCTGFFMWWTRTSIRHSFKLLAGAPKPYWATSGLVLSIVSTIFLPFLVLQTIIYFFALKISN